MQKSLDVLIPVKNEVHSIEELAKRLHSALSAKSIPHSLIFIDDRSTDGTLELLQTISKKYPIQIVKKKGEQGKAFSILEGAEIATASYLAMIDGDLQYPPEVLPEMLELTSEFGVVVANREQSEINPIRKFISKTFRHTIGKFFLGFDVDVQSGLKVFKRSIISHLRKEKLSPWTIDVPLLDTALELGHTIGSIEISFSDRKNGHSKIKLLHSIREIGGQAVRFKFSQKDPLTVQPDKKSSMTGAGMILKQSTFITHTTLEHKFSAIRTFTSSQKIGMALLFAALLYGLIFHTMPTATIFVGVLSAIYFGDVIFNMVLILRSLHIPPEIHIEDEAIKKLKDEDLPVYTILCPLYKEAHIVPQFIKSIGKIEWPKDKLDVQLLLEEDDVETIRIAHELNLPDYVTIQVVPDSLPKTKPKACNYGLNKAKGEYLVIFDAEDMPDPLQLKKVYLAFQRTPPEIKCIQAKLNYYNPNQNLLTRLFTAEYSLWFDVILTGLQTINTTIPLGGTSNHFRTQDLLELKGWDPFNVTEDADLGIRLFKRGARTAIVDSVTLEEANSDWLNWLRQRSRWIKGYMQTYLVHMRNPIQFLRSYGWHSLFFQLSIGGKIGFLFINPFMWVLTASYFLLYAYVGPQIEALYPPYIFYMALTSLIFGNFMFMYYYMIGVAKRQHWTLMKFIFLVPFYWLMVSIAACMALYQLIFKPHYWEKTVHGLHLKEKEIEKTISEKIDDEIPAGVISALENFWHGSHLGSIHKKIKKVMIEKKLFVGGTILVVASIVGNINNFLFNMYLGRNIQLSEFGIMSMYLSIYYLAMIAFGAIGGTVNHQSGYLFGRLSEAAARTFWQQTKVQFRWVGAFLVLAWMTAVPLMVGFFQLPSVTPLILFTPIWIIGILFEINKGYLSGQLRFQHLGLTILIESTVRLLTAVLFVELGLVSLIYITTPLSLLLAWIVSRKLLEKDDSPSEPIASHVQTAFPKRFFITSLLASLSLMSFFSFDILMVKHFLDPVQAGEYGLVSLVGKMIFFVGTLASQFIMPLASRNAGARQDSGKLLKLTMLATLVLSGSGAVVFGLFGGFVGPLLFGDKMHSLVQYLPLFSIGVLGFSLSRVLLQFHLAQKRYTFGIVAFLLSFVQVIGLALFHDSILSVTYVMTGVGILSLITFAILHVKLGWVLAISNNLDAAIDLLRPAIGEESPKPKKLRILFLNWYDTKHVWGGGAEDYAQSISETLVKNGHVVTIFCGNDGHCPRYDKVSGVEIVRRGGLFTLPIWAFLYYVIRFRGRFDLVIDTAKGVPFFTPLYVRVPIIGLIHHIHQEMFKVGLPFGAAQFAMFLEKTAMPLVYRDVQMMTVSTSVKKTMLEMGFGKMYPVRIAPPGVDIMTSPKISKTKHPSILYLGRLRDYKCVDVLIHAFVTVLRKVPNARLTIAGDGNERAKLQELTKTLKISEYVTFTARVSEVEKSKLFTKSWVCVHPSLVEGWGITNIEANACGTPVIASNVDGLRDSVKDGITGILVPPKDSNALATALQLILTDQKLRKKLSNEAKKWAESFSWDRASEEFLKAVEADLKVLYRERFDPKMALIQKAHKS
ncbi:MAG: glycosyltransferase [Microgenomates group bacterium]